MPTVLPDAPQHAPEAGEQAHTAARRLTSFPFNSIRNGHAQEKHQNNQHQASLSTLIRYFRGCFG